MNKITKSIKHINGKAGMSMVKNIVNIYKTNDYARGVMDTTLAYIIYVIVMEYIIDPYIIKPLIYRVCGLDRDGYDL